MSADRLTVYSDYVCPFCYLGRESLARYQSERNEPLSIDWHPYDLRHHKRGPDGEIDTSVADGKGEAYFEQVSENVARLREEYGVDAMLTLDDLPDGVDSFDAQVASWFVQTEYPDRWLAFDEAIFDALWLEGRDIGDVAVLEDIADSVGLDPEEVQSAVGDESVRDQVREQFTAAHTEGVTGVPTFVYGEYVARGAVPPEQLERLVEGSG